MAVRKLREKSLVRTEQQQACHVVSSTLTLGTMKKVYKELKVFDTQTMGDAGSRLQQLTCYEEVSNDSYVSYDMPEDPQEKGSGCDPVVTKFFLDQGCTLGEELIVYRWW